MSLVQLKVEAIMLNEVEYQIQSLKDRQQFDEHDHAAVELGISPANWPLSGVIWPSSFVLASTVIKKDLRNKRVLEIGCGIALSSIALHALGVNITASDYHPLARKLLARNTRNNNLPPLPYLTGNWETHNSMLGEFDLIIGSDVLYEPDHSKNVSHFIDRHAAAGAEVIIVDPGRGNKSLFTRNMQSRDYSHHRERFTRDNHDKTVTRGHILHFNRKPLNPDH